MTGKPPTVTFVKPSGASCKQAQIGDVSGTVVASTSARATSGAHAPAQVRGGGNLTCTNPNGNSGLASPCVPSNHLSLQSLIMAGNVQLYESGSAWHGVTHARQRQARLANSSRRRLKRDVLGAFALLSP